MSLAWTIFWANSNAENTLRSAKLIAFLLMPCAPTWLARHQRYLERVPKLGGGLLDQAPRRRGGHLLLLRHDRPQFHQWFASVGLPSASHTAVTRPLARRVFIDQLCDRISPSTA
jgi:hypothetical protein